MAKSLLQSGTTPEIADMLKFQQAKQQFYYNRTAKAPKPLQECDIVRVKPHQLNDKSWDKATVKKRLDERSYDIETDGGVTLRRNRVHLRATHEDQTPTDNYVEPETLNDPVVDATIQEQLGAPKTPVKVPRPNPPKTPV